MGNNFFLWGAIGALAAIIGRTDGFELDYGVERESHDPIPLDFRTRYIDYEGETPPWNCSPLDGSDYCREYVERAKGEMSGVEDLTRVLKLRRQCYVQSKYNKYDKCEIGFNVQLRVPAVHCEETGLSGYDLGLDVAQYGMVVATNGIYSDWSTNDYLAAKQGEVYTANIPTRAAFPPTYRRQLSAVASHHAGEAESDHSGEGSYDDDGAAVLGISTLFGGAIEEDKERPSQEERCKKLVEIANRRRPYTTEAMQPNGRAVKASLLGYGVLPQPDGSVVHGTTMIKATTGLRLDSDTSFYVLLKNAKAPQTSEIRLPVERFEFPYSKFLTRFRRVDDVADTRDCESVRELADYERNVYYNERDPSDYFPKIFNQIENCYHDSLIEGRSNAAIDYEAVIVTPMKDCGGGYVGFDLGINLGDFGLQVRNSHFYVSAPSSESYFLTSLEGANSKTISLARYIPNKKDFGWKQPDAIQRCRILHEYGSVGTLQRVLEAAPLVLEDKEFFPFVPTGIHEGIFTDVTKYINGTTIISGQDLEFPEDTLFALRLERTNKAAHTIEPDMERFSTTTTTVEATTTKSTTESTTTKPTTKSTTKPTTKSTTKPTTKSTTESTTESTTTWPGGEFTRNLRAVHHA